MKKRLIIILMALILTAQTAFAASLSNFSEMRSYRSAFSDVSASAWYYENIAECYKLGLIDGQDGGTFSPLGYVTIAESIKMAVSLHSIYNTGEALVPTSADGTWYAPYVEYAEQNGIIKAGEYTVFTSRATRSDFAKILALALPEEALTTLCVVPDGAIPDVLERYSYGKAVYMLYRAGVLAGGGGNGEFYPGLPINRAEAATILLRMADSSRRLHIQAAGQLTPEQLYIKCAPAVFNIEVLDDEGEAYKLGSGFFIGSDGLAVTNCHVIGDAKSARVTLANGEVRKITGIYGYSMQYDCALIQVEGSGYPTLEIGNYEPKTGAEIYTIGNPIGLINSFSRGIVSTAGRELEGTRYIQIDAAISSGSSGGALLDAAGRVIGITSAAVTGGQSLNLAMPIGVIEQLESEKLYDLGKYPTEDKLYDDFFPVPDFGAYFNCPLAKTTQESYMTVYTYEIANLGAAETITERYGALLEKYAFIDYSDESSKPLFYNPLFDVVVQYSWTRNGGQTLFIIEIM